MADAKDAIKSPEPDPAIKDKAKTDSSAAAVNPNAQGKPPITVHRSSTAKEVIPFEWKLIGESEGFALTLFKSVEREDVDAQFERVQRDGYYTDLRILGADDKVKQPTSTKARKARQTAKVTKEIEESVKARLAAAKATKVTKKAPASEVTKKSTKTQAAKPAKPKVQAKVKSTPKAKGKAKAKAKPKAKVKAKSKPAKKSAGAAKSKSKSKAKAKVKKRR